MKKVLTLFAFLLLFIGFASAAEVAGVAGVQAGAGMQNGSGPYHDQIIAQGGANGTMNPTLGPGIAMVQTAGSGQFQTQAGYTYRLQRGEKGYQLQAGGFNVTCTGCNFSQEMLQNRTNLHVALSNGRNAEVKIMPETASQTALNRLRLNVCNNETCNISLKEVGMGNQTRLAYQVKAEKRARFLGIFGTNMSVSTEVDAETGQVISTKRPWWSFLASSN
jgi:hypothetical protein